MAKITSKNIEDNIEFVTNPRYGSDPSVDNDLSRKRYVDDQDALALLKTGGTMSGAIAMGSSKITGLSNGTAVGDAINKGQLDGALEGLKPKQAARLASTANLTLSGEQTIDGFLTSTDRVLVKDQTAAEENGIYITAAGAWARSADMDASSEVLGCYVPIQEGTASEGINYVQTGAFTTLDTDDIDFVFFNSVASHTHVAADVTDFDTEVGNHSAVTANTAKVSADGLVTTHSDVSDAGSGAIISTAERNKLSGIEASATADQSDGEIKTAYENNADTNAFTNADESKLDGITGGAEVNDTPGREVKTLIGGDISAGYIELAQPALANSLRVTPIGGIPQEPGVDFTESIVVTNTRVTFAGDLLDLVATEKLLLEYLY